jgi:hypothetical protein
MASNLSSGMYDCRIADRYVCNSSLQEILPVDNSPLSNHALLRANTISEFGEQQIPEPAAQPVLHVQICTKKAIFSSFTRAGHIFIVVTGF